MLLHQKCKNEPSKARVIRKKLDRKPLVDSYPNLIEKAVEFIKLNGYSAHAGRRNSIGSSGTGVSVDAV